MGYPTVFKCLHPRKASPSGETFDSLFGKVVPSHGSLWGSPPQRCQQACGRKTLPSRTTRFLNKPCGVGSVLTNKWVCWGSGQRLVPPTLHHALWSHALDTDLQETQAWPLFQNTLTILRPPPSCGSAGKKVTLRAMALQRLPGAVYLGTSPVLGHGFPGAGMEPPCLQGNSALHGTWPADSTRSQLGLTPRG